MRDIKFRAWDEEDNFMYQNIGLGGNTIIFKYEQYEEDEDADIDPIYWCHKNNEDVHVMQYTGLKDKNGKEIYEGDIVFQLDELLGENITGVVKLIDGGYFIVTVDEKDAWFLFNGVGHNAVLGNIYEDRHLINS